MPVTTVDASQARYEVLHKYESFLPAGLATRVRSLGLTEIFKILPAAQYRPVFDEYYRNFFAATNAKAFGTEFTIGVANAPDDVCGTFNCPAFCAPASNVTDRTIYVNEDENVTFGTIYHEFIHFLEHPNFYPEFYAMGGDNPSVLEGVTEHLTRQVSPRVEHDRRSQDKYQKWFAMVQRATASLGQARDQLLAELAFKGKLIPGFGAIPAHLK